MAQRSATVTVKKKQISSIMSRHGSFQWSCKLDKLYAWWASRLGIPSTTVLDIMTMHGYKPVQSTNGKNAGKYGFVLA
jgi:hypothetical protein